MRNTVVAPIPDRKPALDAAVDAPLELALFGTIAVRRNGAAIPLRLPQTAVRLLAYLLLNRERNQSREHVAFTLWPDDDEADARANLRRKLHLLLRALPPSREPWILTTATSLGWNPAAPYRLDVADFEVRSRSAETLADADALYTDDLLVDLYDDWIVRERDRLRAAAMENLLTLVARAQKRRDYAEAIRYAQRLRALDPWREDAVRALIGLRYEAGDRAGALTEFERFRAAIAAEMGVEPMPETVCVYERVLAHADTSQAAAAAAAAPAPSEAPAKRPAGLPFVARAREYDALVTAWAAASNGGGGSLLVTGEPGIGKTRLIDEFAAFADSNGARVLRGTTTPFELMPYEPFTEALRSALPILRETPVEPLWLAVLATLVPQLHVAFPGLRQLIALDAEPERTRLFEAFEVVVGALSARRPTVLILEDLHWAGAATIGMLEYLARHSPLHRLLIVGSYREGEAPRTHPLRGLRRHLERERLLRVIALGPLDAGAIGEIVAHLADGDPGQHAALATELRAASDGNPFFLGEVIANEREAGFLDDTARRWQRRDTVDDGAGLSLTSTLSARLERLPPRVRSLAEVAAVIGRAFSAELVREVSGADERSTLDGLGELLDRRLVREVDAGGTHFTFSHQLIAAAVYAQMPSEARSRRHRRAGSIIEDIYSEQIEQYAGDLAAHFDRGGEPERAAEYYCLAARRALTLHANDEAKTLAERGRVLTLENVTRFRAVEIIEEAAHRLGDRDGQRDAIAQLRSIAQHTDDPELLRESLRRRIALAHDCGERDEERDAIAALAERMGGARTPWQATFAQLKGSYLTAIGAYREARTVMSDALSNVSATDHPRIFVECWCALVELARFEGRYLDVRAFLNELPTFETKYDVAQVVTLLETACAAAMTIQDFPAVKACAERLLDHTRAIGYREGEAAAYRFMGTAALRLFEIEQARVFLARSIEMFRALGQRLKELRALGDFANLYTTIGRFDEAIAQFEAADRIALDISYDFGHVACLNNISHVAYLKGDFALAKSAAIRALEGADRIGAPSARAHALVSIGVAERELGRLDDAIAHLEEGTRLERELNETADIGEDLCELIVALLARDELDRADVLAAEVLALAENSGPRLSRPQFVFWTAAAVCRAAGDHARARTLLSRARASLDDLEALIPEVESKQAFRGLSHNRLIDDAFENDRWPIQERNH
jgi:DNA-binding SARP family transcriptional activator/predicted negative regulator of RcsB-dependent stress response